MGRKYNNRFKKDKFIQGEYFPLAPEKYAGPRPIIFRSSWELKMMEFFDRCSRCKRWSSERTVINYVNSTDGQVHRYFIDFMAIFINEEGKEDKWYLEIKPFSQTRPPVKTPRKAQKTYIMEVETWQKNQSKWKAAVEFAKHHNGKFKIMTEKEIFRNPEEMKSSTKRLLQEKRAIIN